MKGLWVFLLLLLLGTGYTQGAVRAQTGKRVVRAAELLGWIAAKQPVDLEGVVIEGDLDLTELGADEKRVVNIESPIRIVYSTFNGSVTAVKGRRASLITTHFHDDLNLSGSTFKGDVRLSRAVFAGANFDGSHFEGAALFQAITAADISFLAATFGRVDRLLPGMRLCRYVPNNGATADFTDAQFSKSVSFGRARFCQMANFVGTHFLNDALFIYARFSPFNPANFFLSTFSRQAVFQGARFGGEAEFSGTRFNDKVDFSQAVFGRTARFLNSRFENAASFREARIKHIHFASATLDVIDLTRAHISGRLDLGGTDYRELRALGFDFVALDRPLPPSAQGDDPLAALDTLVKLEENFRSQRKLDLANEAFYQRMVLERSQKHAAIQILEWAGIDVLFGYFVRPWNTVWPSVGLIVLFAIIYYRTRVIRRVRVAAPKPRELRFSLRLGELPLARKGEFAPLKKRGREAQPKRLAYPHSTRFIKSRRRFVTTLGYSFGVFTKFSFGRCVSTGYLWVVVLEWFLGLIILAGFAYSLSNTSRILQVLFGTLF